MADQPHSPIETVMVLQGLVGYQAGRRGLPVDHL